MTALRKWVEFEEIIRFIQTTPDTIEADSVCRNAISQISAMQTRDVAEGLQPCSKLVEYRRRLQAELHRLSLIENQTAWRKAVLAIFGQDGVDQCVTWIVSERSQMECAP